MESNDALDNINSNIKPILPILEDERIIKYICDNKKLTSKGYNKWSGTYYYNKWGAFKKDTDPTLAAFGIAYVKNDKGQYVYDIIENRKKIINIMNTTSSFKTIDSEELKEVIKCMESYNDDFQDTTQHYDRIDSVPYHLNLFAVRRNSWDNDEFADTFYMFWNTNTEKEPLFVGLKTGEVQNEKKTKTYKTFTTKPGMKYRYSWIGKKDKNGNDLKGLGIMLEGFHKNCWEISTHNGSTSHIALTSKEFYGKPENATNTNKPNPMCVARVKDAIFNERYTLLTANKQYAYTLEKGYFGMNFHKTTGSQSILYNIGPYSEGCQVFAVKVDQEMAMLLAKFASYLGQKYFSYFIIEENAFLRMIDNYYFFDDESHEYVNHIEQRYSTNPNIKKEKVRFKYCDLIENLNTVIEKDEKIIELRKMTPLKSKLFPQQTDNYLESELISTAHKINNNSNIFGSGNTRNGVFRRISPK